MPESTPAEGRPSGPMRSLSPAQRRQWQEETLHSPRLRYGIPARLLFRLEDVVFGRGRSVPKFRALEIINRVAYQAWEQAAYYLAGKLRERSARARQLHDTVEDDRAEQDNEKWHVLILDELQAAEGRRESWLRFRLLPQLIAFVVYQQFWLMRALRPEGIEWPLREDGAPSFRLDDLAGANAVREGNAHEALSDVRATLGLARRMRASQPRLWEYALRLRQINAAVEESAKGEFARLRDARAALDRHRQHAAQNHGAAMTAQLNDIFACVGVRRFEVSQQRLVNRFTRGRINDAPEMSAAHCIERGARCRDKDY